jgi:hypothetical protein
MPRFLARLLLICIAAGNGLCAATVSWTGAGADGNWSTAANWLGGAPPTSSDAAAFPSPSSVTIDSPSAVAGSVLGSPAITIPGAGVLTVSGTIASALIIMDGGQLKAATVESTIIATATHGGTLSGITIGSSGVLSLVNADGAHCTITDGITIDGSVLLGSFDGSNSGYLVCSGSQSWGGSTAGGGKADIVFGNAIGDAIQVQDGSDALTLLSGLTLHGLRITVALGSGNALLNDALLAPDGFYGIISVAGAVTPANAATGTLVNTGTIRCDTGSPYGSLTIAVGSWSNSGVIEADAALAALGAAGTSTNDGQIIDNGGAMTLSGTWDPAGTGTIACTGVATLTLAGSYSGVDALHLAPSPSSTIALSGTLTAAVIDLTALYPVQLAGGTITGGTLHPPVTIVGSGANTLVCTPAGGTLDNVVIAPSTVLDLFSLSGNCTVIDGLTVNGSIHLGSATAAGYGTLSCRGTQSWGGSSAGGGPADIVFGYQLGSLIQDANAGDTLTLLPGLTIHGLSGAINLAAGTTLVNQALIESDGLLYVFGGGALVNTGTIQGGSLQDQFSFTLSSFTNQGVVALGSSTTQSWSLTGDFVQTPAGTLRFAVAGLAASPVEQFAISGNAALAGTITVTPIAGYHPQQGDAFTLMPVTGATTSSATASTTAFILSYPGSGVVATASDATTPSVAISVAPTTSQSPIPFLLTFSEPVSAPGLGSLTVGNGTALSVSGGPLAYTAMVQPTLAEGQVSVSIAAGAAFNSGAVGNSASATATTTYHVAPNLVITPATGAVTTTMPVFTISASTAVGGLGAGGLLVAGAAIGTITQVDPTTITVAMNMVQGGTVSFQVLPGAVSDALGGVNIASPPVVVTYAPPGSAVWTGSGGDGHWSTAANWLAGVLPGTGADVLIPPMATVSVDVPTADLHTVNLQGSMTIDAGATLWVGYGAAGTNSVTLNGGPLTVSQGTLQSAIVENGSGGIFTIVSHGTLDGVAIGAQVVLDLSLSAADCLVVDGLTVDGAVQIGGNDTGSYSSIMHWQGSQIWGGQGEIRFGATNGDFIAEANSAGATLTIADPLRIHGIALQFELNDPTSVLATTSQNPLGGLSADVFRGSIMINLAPGTWSNTGTIATVPGTTLTVAGTGSWSSSGAFSSTGTTFDLGGEFTAATLTTFPGLSGNTINIQGTMTGDAILDAGVTGPWYLAGGTLSHCTIGSTAAGGTLYATDFGGTLDAVTIGAGTVLDVGRTADGFCTIVDGITIDGTMLVSPIDPYVVQTGIVSWSGTQSWGGTGDIAFGLNGPTANVECTASGTLTILSPLRLHGLVGSFDDYGIGSSIVNQGTIADDDAGTDLAGGFSFETTSLINQGTISLGVGIAGSLTCTGTFTQTAAGTLNLTATGPAVMGELEIQGPASLAGTLTISAAAGYVPRPADQFTIITSYSPNVVSGSFASVSGPFSVTYQAASVTATMIPGTSPALTVSSAAFANASPIPFTLTFSSPVMTPTAGALSVSGGSIASISGGPSVYTAAVTPSLAGGTSVLVSVMVPAGAVGDGRGDANSASNTCSCTYEIAPTITVAPASGTAVAGAPVFTVTFSNQVTGLQAGGLALSGTGVSLAAISPDAATLTSTYVITTALSGRETVHFGVLAHAVNDQAGNANAASATVDVTGNAPASPAPPAPAPTAQPGDGGHRCGLGSGLAALACALMILAWLGVRPRR